MKVSNLINFLDLNYLKKILRFLNASVTSSSSRFYSEPRPQRHFAVLRWSANTPICADVGLGRGSEEAAFNSESGHDHLWKCLFIIIRSRNLSSWDQKLLEGFSFLLNEWKRLGHTWKALLAWESKTKSEFVLLLSMFLFFSMKFVQLAEPLRPHSVLCCPHPSFTFPWY